MFHEAAHQIRIQLVRLWAVAAFLAGVVGATRAGDGGIPIATVFGLAKKAYAAAKMLKSGMGNHYIAIIQMDPETFPPAAEPQSNFSVSIPAFTDQILEFHYDTDRPLPNSMEELSQFEAPKSGPAGRVITDRTEGWGTGSRGEKMLFGGGKMVRVNDAGRMRVMKRVEVDVISDDNLWPRLDKLNVRFGAVDEICPDSGPLAGGRVYVYTSGCTFKDITHFDDWAADDTAGHQYFAQQFCGGLTEEQWGDCLQYLACAVDKLAWADQPSVLLNAATRVQPQLVCPDAGKVARVGFYHEHHTCRSQWVGCETGPCDFCGTEGLCCKHPGHAPLRVLDLEKHGCDSLGCYGRHCCVRATPATG